MDIACLKDESYEVWFAFLDAEVLVRYVPLGEVREIARASRTVRVDGSGRRAEEFDHTEAGRLLGRAAVRGWRGITLRGEEYPYTLEHCDFLMARWAEFARFVNETCLDLRGMVEREAAEREKKSSLTSGREGSIRA
jgi:hypothetical protein